ncbi:MAG: tRNA (guanosine(46)-N7)-methyltransferase TrmB [Ruminiclostridium sp.]|nr:tRNA (guanosine(46)-N7)-methyltransferase TrmB [Ruminiclostridium sp.]
MRMRKKRNLESRIEACGAVNLGWLQDYASEMRGENIPEIITSEKVFGNSNPIHLEIGCGKGQFAEEIAKRNPDINYIAVEQNVNVLVTAMERTRDSGTPNLKYLMGMAEYLEKVFEPGSVQCIYLNFSCPFPKNAYAKHRLTHQRFLDIYRNILAPGGVIYQKTDNAPFFEFSLNSYCDNGFRMRNITFDLHNSKIEGNIITEYEAKFSSMGFPIYYVEAFPQKN